MYNAGGTCHCLYLVWSSKSFWNEPRWRTSRKNSLQTVVSPDDSEAVWINQDAYVSMGNLDKGTALDYSIKKSANGIYVFVIKGEATINGEALKERDAIGISDIEKIKIEANEAVELLLLDVPMN